MDGVTELAKHIKNRDNPSPYTPMFGKVISLPKLTIQLGNNILLDADDIKSTFDICLLSLQMFRSETERRDICFKYVR